MPTHNSKRWESKLVPEEGTVIRDVIEVETWVDKDFSKNDRVPDITT